MTKIMIVDDMPIFLEYLKEAIDWAAYGFELCCEAKNGQEAYEKAVIHQPDIVLTDIMMPYVDGLMLTEKLNQLNPEIMVVLITGNSEFEFARKAIRLGVVDYIVKPFEKEELILTLLNLQDNINKAIESKIEKKDEQYLLQEQALRALIYSKNGQQAPIQTLVDTCAYFVMTVEVEAAQDHMHLSEKAMNIKSVLGELYRDYMQSDALRYFFTDYESRLIFIHEARDFEAVTDEDELKRFIGYIKERLNLTLTVGIGNCWLGLKGIRQSYLESINALRHRFQHGGNKAIKYESISAEEKTYGFYSAEVNEVILNHLHQHNECQAMAVLETIFEESTYSFEYRRMVNMGLISLLLSYLVKAGKNIDDVFSEAFAPYTVINTSDISEQNQFIKDAYQRVFKYLLAHQQSRSSQVAHEALNCMVENYSNPDFNMADLSKKLLVNQTYLRKMFKSEMGMTISEYLTKIRMDRASDLIKEDKWKLAAISERVGYRDPGYFSKCFKQYFGVSPSDFK